MRRSASRVVSAQASVGWTKARGAVPTCLHRLSFRRAGFAWLSPTDDHYDHDSPPLPHRLEADLQAVAGRFREAAERARRGHTPPAFEPRHRALRRLHALGQLRLVQARAAARLRDGKHQRELLLQPVVFLADLRVFHPFLVQMC